MLPTSRASRRAAGLALAGALVLAAPAAGQAPASVAPAGTDERSADERLSDESAESYWAFSQSREVVRSEPDTAAPTLARLRLYTELGAPEVYLVLRRSTDSDSEVWLQVRLPMRPNGSVGWVPEDALGGLHVTYTSLVIDLRKHRATLYERGKRVWRAPVGIGKSGTPTPRGRFYVRQRLRLGRSGGPYGVFAFGTSAYSAKLSDWPGGGVIGIHGTNEPGLIPGAVSHGCVRVRNSAVSKLRNLMELGTPIEIR